MGRTRELGRKPITPARQGAETAATQTRKQAQPPPGAPAPVADAMGSVAKKYPSELPGARPVVGFADPLRGRSTTDLVVFGATGDLMKRLLMPSLLRLSSEQALPAGSTVLGVAPPETAPDSSDAAFRTQMAAAAQQFAKASPDAPEVQKLTSSMGFQPARFTSGDLAVVKARLEAQDRNRPAGAQRLLYLALPPAVLPEAISAMKAAGLLDVVPGQAPARLILEKPFGHDLQSARALRDLLAESLVDPEGKVRWQDRVLLIDHYVGKPAVIDLLDLRFGRPTKDAPWNGAFESMFNAEFIGRVEIQAEEKVDVGSAHRGAFIDAVGAFRDMFQSHLQQVASLLVMEKPGQGSASFDQLQADALMSFHTLTPDEVASQTVRGQYQGYRQIEGVAPDSKTETFFAVRTQVDNPKWNGVPFLIWSGKALEEKETSVRVDFKKLSPPLLELISRQAPGLAARLGPQSPASLHVDIDPKPRFTLEVGGEKLVLKAPEAFDSRLPHQRLLEDAMDGKTDLFVSPEEALAQWEHADAVLGAWSAQPGGPVLYTAGTLPGAAAEYMDDDETGPSTSR